MSGIFNVYFNGVYWIGVILEENEDRCRIGKYIFGSEPTPNEIFEWARKGCPGLVMSELDQDDKNLQGFDAKKSNPKRMQREARRALENKTIGSYTHEKLQLALEAKKMTTAMNRKKKRALEAEERFLKKQLKKKKKKRGR